MNNRKKTLIIYTVFFTVITLAVAGATYAFFTAGVNTTKEQTASVQTGTMSLSFYDNNDSITAVLKPGQTTQEKILILENTGTLPVDGVDIYWKDLLNEYLPRSLSYTLTRSTEGLNGNYTEVKTGSIPHTETASNKKLYTEKDIPVGATYYYKLTITLNNLPNVNQDADYNASLSSGFTIESVHIQPSYTATSLSKTKLSNFVDANSPENLIITDTGGHTDGTDVGTDAGHIYAWMDGTTAYVSAKDPGYKLKPSTGEYFFSESSSAYSNIQYIDVTLLDISSFKSLYRMFSSFGHDATTFEIRGLDNWDTSRVTNMGNMFGYAGYSATTFEIRGLDNWDTSKVTDMSTMFSQTGCSATTFNLNLSNWDTSSVTDMRGMFSSAGKNATTFNLNLSGWDTSSVTDMYGMFDHAGYSTTQFEIRGLNNWDVSSVLDMSDMFWSAGSKATTWSIGDLSGWDVSHVTDMKRMFQDAGKSASYTLDLSSWQVSLGTAHWNFNNGVTGKVIPPVWVN